jgi:hypothetical protein
VTTLLHSPEFTLPLPRQPQWGQRLALFTVLKIPKCKNHFLIKHAPAISNTLISVINGQISFRASIIIGKNNKRKGMARQPQR